MKYAYQTAKNEFHLRDSIVTPSYKTVTVPTVDADGKPVMEWRPKMQDGKPVNETKYRTETVTEMQDVEHTFEVPDSNGGTKTETYTTQEPVEVEKQVPYEEPVYEEIQTTHEEQEKVEPPLPDGYVEVSEEEHKQLFEAQSQGKRIQAGADGRPEAVDPPAPTLEEQSNVIRVERDKRIAETDWFILRQTEQASLSAEQYAGLLQYRQELRDMPQQEGFPWGGIVENAKFPVKPNFI